MHEDRRDDMGALATLKERFEGWRGQRVKQERIPVELLGAAKGLMGRYPPSVLAKTLRLNYRHFMGATAGGLGDERPVGSGSEPGRRRATEPVFVKIRPARTHPGEGGMGDGSAGVIEFENPQGFKVRVAGADRTGMARELLAVFCGRAR